MDCFHRLDVHLNDVCKETRAQLGVTLKAQGGIRERVCEGGVCTWHHGVEALTVLVGHTALVARFVHEVVDEAHHGVCHVGTLGIFEAALRVVAFRHAARITTRPGG